MTIIEAHNVFRNMENLSSLKDDEYLNYLAYTHAKFMARRNWLNPFKLEHINNIATGNNSDIIIKQWINQPDTRAKMFGNYMKIGFGSFKSKTNITYWCVLYE